MEIYVAVENGCVNDIKPILFLQQGYSERNKYSAKKPRIDLVNGSFEIYENPVCYKCEIKTEALNMDFTGDVELEDHFVPLTSLLPAEAVMSIPKIRQRILSYSSPQDLLQFRIVSRDWRRDATNDKLLKSKRNRIIIKSLPQCNARSLKWHGKIKKPLHELLELMNSTGSYPFPCFRFSVSHSNRIKEGKQIQEFLLNHGSRMKFLFLNLFYPKCCSEVRDINDTERMCSHSVNWLLEIVTELLLQQTPNVLELDISYRAAWEFCGWNCRPILARNIREYNPANLHTKLQTVKLWEGARRTVFEYLCRLAPNLKTIKDCHLDYYLEPVNRLYLIDELSYHPGLLDPKMDLIVKRIANMDGKLQLEKLIILAEDIYEDSESWPEAVGVCNKLLEKSRNSGEKLWLAPLGFLPGLRIPKMLNVNEIYFDGSFPAIPHTHFFPQGILISETFPNLHTIELCEGFTEDVSSDGKFIIGSEDDVMPSVKVVITSGNLINLKHFKRWFPNALIRN